MKKETVTVLGGGGKQGQSCILDLLRNKEAENIIAVDMNQKAEALNISSTPLFRNARSGA